MSDQMKKAWEEAKAAGATLRAAGLIDDSKDASRNPPTLDNLTMPHLTNEAQREPAANKEQGEQQDALGRAMLDPALQESLTKMNQLMREAEDNSAAVLRGERPDPTKERPPAGKEKESPFGGRSSSYYIR